MKGEGYIRIESSGICSLVRSQRVVDDGNWTHPGWLTSIIGRRNCCVGVGGCVCVWASLLGMGLLCV